MGDLIIKLLLEQNIIFRLFLILGVVFIIALAIRSDKKDFKCGKTVNSYPSLLTISLGYLYLYYRVDNINGVTYEQNRANTETI